MRYGFWIAALLLAASPAPFARAAEPKGGADGGSSSSRAEQAREESAARARERMEKVRASQKGAGHAPTKAAAAETAQRAAAMRAKSVYLYAVDSCAQSSRCDKALIDDAEQRFLEACVVCSTPERCEAERDAIKGGTASSRVNPCSSSK